MPLDRHQVRQLLSFVANTGEDEIACDECLVGMAEFAERELIGADLPAALARVAAHLATCPECAEEYRVLLDVLAATGPDGVATPGTPRPRD
jgi:hypothetical protein